MERGMERGTDHVLSLYSEGGTALQISGVTDNNGQVVFNLPEQSIKIRTTYLHADYWSPTDSSSSPTL